MRGYVKACEEQPSGIQGHNPGGERIPDKVGSILDEVESKEYRRFYPSFIVIRIGEDRGTLQSFILIVRSIIPEPPQFFNVPLLGVRVSPVEAVRSAGCRRIGLRVASCHVCRAVM